MLWFPREVAGEPGEGDLRAEAMDNLVILFSVGIAILVIVGVYFFIVDRKKAKSRS